MEWQDEGVVLSARRLGERDAVAQLLTRDHGRHAGLVRGGASRRLRPLLQPGNRLACRWRARLAQQLGSFTVEPLRLYASTVLDSPLALAAMGSALELAAATVGERDPHPRLYAGLLWLLEELAARPEDWLTRYVKFELLVLEEAGFGLQLERCAVTGRTEELAYVSPRTGRAVSRQAAGSWAPRLLPLPAFLCGAEGASTADILEGLRLCGFFLRRHLLAPTDRPLPAARERLLRLLRDQLCGAEPEVPTSSAHRD